MTSVGPPILPDNGLFGLAYELLAAATALLGADAPPVRYVTPPQPSFDCREQLTVHSDSLLKEIVVGTGDLFQFASVDQASQNSVGFVVTCTRCTPIPEHPDNPPAAELTAVSERLLADVYVLWRGLQRMIREGTLWEGYTQRVLIGPALPVVDQGGTAGWIITLRVEL